MAIRVKLRAPDLSRAVEKIENAARRELARAAEDVPERITFYLQRGQKPDGSAQPQSAQSTIDRKAREGKDNTPGVDTGRLSDPSYWTSKATERGAIVEPPDDRRQIIGFLEARDYEFLGVPPESRDDIERELEFEFKDLKISQ